MLKTLFREGTDCLPVPKCLRRMGSVGGGGM